MRAHSLLPWYIQWFVTSMANAVHKGGLRTLFDVHCVFLRSLYTVIQSVQPAADKTWMCEKPSIILLSLLLCGGAETNKRANCILHQKSAGGLALYVTIKLLPNPTIRARLSLSNQMDKVQHVPFELWYNKHVTLLYGSQSVLYIHRGWNKSLFSAES